MANISLEPYLFFKGNCREAMNFYKDAFGGEVEFTEANPEQMGDMPNKDWFKGKIMHSSLKGPVNIMGSDSSTASDKAAKVELSLGGTDEAQMRAIFDKLAEGGNVRTPLAKQFWGDIFGQLTDKYNIDWIMNIGPESQPSV
ncbi:glyoxalase/bleomycin resistance/extradiol dioxygenase family protein [Candidatus Saccharibacteria bacterium]|nr:glyoxalase/bleomycin resistance/extradiol dioxygenase family protein [Candidatus Saccharibacteria bacterium]